MEGSGGGKGWYHLYGGVGGRKGVVSFAQNCQFTATQKQVRANCYAAAPGGNKGHYIMFAAFALRLPE